MDYHEAANFLFDLRRFSVKPGTERVATLLDRLGNPESALPCVQITGSNGKGSTARMVESILREAGLSVGLYTSPHLSSLSERIRVDGRPIPDAAIAEFVDEVKPWLVDRAADEAPLTFFEVVTAMAVHDFVRRDVDVAVLEVGLGGEYDATSAVDPVATGVTNVALEHTSVLGDSIAEIARTKARIATPGSPMVTACSGEALRVVRKVAGDADAPVTTVAGPEADDAATGSGADDADAGGPSPAIVATYEGRASPTDARIRFEGESAGEYRIPLVGAHQATNAAVAAALSRRTMRVLGADEGSDGSNTGAGDASLGDRALAGGLARATWPGRFEVVRTAPLTVLDGAHNPAACGRLAETLAEYDYADLHLVCAAMHDKDHAANAAALPDADRAITCRPALDRAEDPAVLAAALRRSGIDDVTAGGDVADAVSAALAVADDDDCVLLAGSLFAVAEARSALTRTVTPKSVDGPAEATRALRSGRVPPASVDRARDGVDHRVCSLDLRGDRAERVAATLRTVGGEAAIGGVDAGRGSRVDGGSGFGSGGGELSTVTLAGSVAEFRELCARLDDADDGLAGVATDLRETLELDVAEDVNPDAGADVGSDASVDVGSDASVDVGSDAGADVDPDDRGYPWTDDTAVMGVLNVTPDSFHDGGRHEALDAAVAGARRMVEAGVNVIDVGGESTRPGADPVPVAEEMERVVPVIEAVREVQAVADGDVLVSVDTRKAPVARAALDAGADVINDVTGLEDPRMREVVADAECPVVVMHSVDAPVDPNRDPEYDDVVADVIADLRERLLLAEVAGIDRERVIVDPGIGFGKSAAESFELLGRVDEFAALGCPVLVGHSHKSLFATVDRGPNDREHATVAATALAVERGADLVRVHDVAENRAAVDVVAAATDPESVE